MNILVLSGIVITPCSKTAASGCPGAGDNTNREIMTKQELENKYPEYFSNVYCGFISPEGWNNIIDRCCQKLVDAKINGEAFKFDQIKEKFGTLRLYYSVRTDDFTAQQDEAVFDIIEEAEDESRNTCDLCGKPAETRDSHGWIFTQCVDCYP